MSSKKGIYKDRIEIIGEIVSYQGSEATRRNWLQGLNENKYRVVVQLVSQNPEMHEALEKILDFKTVSIEFPQRDILEKPKCNRRAFYQNEFQNILREFLRTLREGDEEEDCGSGSRGGVDCGWCGSGSGIAGRGGADEVDVGVCRGGNADGEMHMDSVG